MPVETDADRRMLVREADFAVPVAWAHTGGTANFTAIFDDDYQLAVSPFMDAGAESSTPHFLAVASDIPATGRNGDAVTINAKPYTVVEIKPDGTGMTAVRLQES